jgi:glycosyltransferase involved in cell wall biosynthesis
VLFVAHNHPAVRPGGAEAYALEVHRAFRARGVESVFLAKAGPPMSPEPPPGDRRIWPRPGGDNEWFFWTDLAGWDALNGTFRDKKLYTKVFGEFLLEHRPDVVHFQHTAFLGYDLVRAARRFLPDAALVYTLHELLPICHHHGQMVRTSGNELCERATPAACHGCFSDVTPAQFFRRTRYIQGQLADVDLFVVPSRFLHRRFSEWGLGGRLRIEEYGRLSGTPLGEPDQNRGRPSRLGFFGQVNPFKGLHVLLEALKHVDDPAVTLVVHGANLDLQRGEYRRLVESLVNDLSDRVTFAGPYTHDELPRLMAAVDWVVVPSIWWENSPLVIQEAFQHERPVICSDIGGMAEKVADRVSGLHFPVGDSTALADVLRRATSTRELWARLRSAIPPVHPMDAHVDTLLGWYDELIDRRKSA